MQLSRIIPFQILAVFSLIFLLCLPGVSAREKKVKQVVFIRYNLKDKPEESAIVDSFKLVMEQRGFIEGKNIEYVDFVARSPERESAEEVLNTVEKYTASADMFVTTSWTSLYVRSRLARQKVPQLFAPALKATALNMLPSITAEPETNLSGVYLMYPPEKVLRMAKLILPGIKKYGYVYDSRIPADIMFKAAYSQLSEHERHGTSIYFLDLASGTDTVLQKLKLQKIDAFGGVVGMFKNLEQLSQSNLPIITPLLFDRDKKNLLEFIGPSNVIAGLYNPFDDCGTKAAQMTADIFEGHTTIEKTVPRPAQQLAVINTISAQRLGIPIPFSALEVADIVFK